MFEPIARAAVLVGFLVTALSAQPAKVDFKRDVQPVFKAHCIDCHGPALQMNGFRLDRRRDAMQGGTLAVIGPGNSDGSRLYWKLQGNKFGQQMPPAGPLKPIEIDTIKRWIDEGAIWPDDASGEAPLPPVDSKAAGLMEALRQGDAHGFRRTLTQDKKAATLRGPGGSTPLMYAVLYGRTADMQLLIESGADVNTRNNAGATALMWAADDVEKTRLLLDRGADVNAKSEDGMTPLMIASNLFGKNEVVKLLLEKGANVNVKSPGLFGEMNPLVEAGYGGDENTMRLLVQHGADPKSGGPLAVALSMRSQCKACVDILLKGAPPSTVIPAMFFVSPPLGPAFGVAPLLSSGGDANAKDPMGNSILAVAAASPAYPVDAVKALLDKGADVNSTGATGETAIELAKRHGRTPMVEFLLKAGAKDKDVATASMAQPKPASNVRAAVERGLPLLQHNDTTFLRKSGCVSCHNNTLTAVTVATARKSGVHVDEQQVQQHVKTIGMYLETWRERALQNVGIPGDADTVGYILLGLAAANYPPDAATDAQARYLKGQQRPDGHWIPLGTRPPLESSAIQVTATAMRGLQVYAPKSNRAEYDRAIKLAASWIASAQPMTTEDRAFQLMGLAWSGAPASAIQKAATGLIAEQRSDGGWSQIPTLGSDSYASGQSLTALLQSGAAKATDPAVKRGLEFLRITQAEDGSWHVRRRAIPIQPHFESDFPYGKDQFISAAGTNWAVTAMALAAR
jgi:ankyrin repeat protein